jgi:cobalt-zinc-cadmium resistance protein CzcA
LQYFNTFGLNYANTIISTAFAKLKTEEIDYFEYADLICRAYNIRFEYLDAMNKYNQLAIQLEHYAY